MTPKQLRDSANRPWEGAGSVTSADYSVPCPGRCHGGRNGTSEAHVCPYKEDVNDDSKTTCHCCYECERECADDI